MRQAEAGTYAARPRYASHDEVGASLDLIDRLVMKQRKNVGVPAPVAVNQSKSGILNYDTGETAALVNVDGFTSGRLQPGEVKTVRATFKAPKGAKKVGITLSGIGTFDDVDLGN